MKIHQLKESESLELVEVSVHTKAPDLPTFGDKPKKTNISEFKQIQMKVFTDGEIFQESEEITKNIQEYYIGKNKYPYNVDTLKIKNICLRNYSYIITYLIAKEWTTVGNIGGWFDVIKDISVYLENPKDRKTLKRAKKVIKQIETYNNSINYSSLFSMLKSQEMENNSIEIEKLSKNVYTLKKAQTRIK